MKIQFEKILMGAQHRRFALMLVDFICFCSVNILFYFVSYRAANSMPVEEGGTFLVNALVHFIMIALMRWVFEVYRNVWRYANTKAYFMLVLADAAAGALTIFVVRLLQLVWDGVYYGLWQAAVVGSLTALLVLMTRFSYSLVYKALSGSKSLNTKAPVAIVGAGKLGAHLADDLRDNPNSGYSPVFFVDVDASKIGNNISGLKVYDTKTAQHLIREMDVRDIIVSITKQDSERLAHLYHHYTNMGCRVRIYDSLIGERYEENGKRRIRDFSIEDLLFRQPININDENTEQHYSNKSVLITGGGGSIGSELCRSIARCSPRQLIIFDIYENNAYDIQQELNREYGDKLNLAVEIGSVRDKERLDQLFAKYKPEIVIHAAAHKHVPLMEYCGAEAIKNNVFGTYNTADMAEKYGAEKFILISTDKAVNPTSIMGASKRICEMIVQCRVDSKTSFAAVRFGNVLGSNGSVIPLFKKQIAQGGPVTVTDRRIIRYFMTIPEAVQLVLRAGVMAKSGELFVLDMGKPVKIYELAENMIRLSGYVPGSDIEIVEVGLRPGEKLYEELLIKTEKLDKTENDLIFIEHDMPHSRKEVDIMLDKLREVMNDDVALKSILKILVYTYRDPDEINMVKAVLK